MKRCAAPCVGHVDEAGYALLVRGTALFLRGRSEELAAELRERMRAAAAAERFEEAARLRDRLAAVAQTVERQRMVSERPVDRDVFGLARRGGEVEVQVLHVREGRVIGTAGYSLSGVEIDDGEVMSSFLGQYYAPGQGGEEREAPRELLCSTPFDDGGALAAFLSERGGRRVEVRVPQRGPQRELVEVASSNAELALGQRLEARESVRAALEELRTELGLARLPARIECYDVSTLGGTLPVASRVVFVDGRPVAADYRRYRLKQATGGDDLDCLREVMRRRLARVEREPLPDLLAVDGGRGQLGVVLAALRDAGLSVDALGLAKERDAESRSGPRVRRSGGLKAERIFLPGRANPVLLPPGSRGLLLLQRVRDESHRFAVEFQRSLRQKLGLTSVLEELPGIGPRKRRALLARLGSLRAVREASEETLRSVPGLSARDAATIRRFFDGLAQAESAEPSPAGS
jgi:excinuclease ABC subunit C